MVQRRLQLLAQDAVLGEVVIVGTEELMMAQQEQTTARLGAALVDVIRLGSVEKTEPAEQKEVTGTKCGDRVLVCRVKAKNVWCVLEGVTAVQEPPDEGKADVHAPSPDVPRREGIAHPHVASLGGR
jgi:hypothetical protein